MYTGLGPKPINTHNHFNSNTGQQLDPRAVEGCRFDYWTRGCSTVSRNRCCGIGNREQCCCQPSLGTGLGAGVLDSGAHVLGAGMGSRIRVLQTDMGAHFLGASVGTCLGTSTGTRGALGKMYLGTGLGARVLDVGTGACIHSAGLGGQVWC